MKKEDLIALGLTEEQAQQVLDGFGTMVPKSRLDDKITEVNDYKQQIADRDTQLEKLKKVDAKGMQDEIDRLQQENQQTKADFESQLSQKDYDFALTEALRTAKAKNPIAVKALLNVEAIKLVNGQLVGLDEQITALKASDDYLFVADGLKGKTHPNPEGGGKPDKNPFSKDNWNLTEQGRLLREEPEKAKQLQASAGQ
ncbi:phage scaffolding protein [Lysinibacillus sphaericus]|uniref:Scaffold protein gp20 membrane protease membrane protease membrane protease n=1 Tax=Lysinibacillus sphaericus OT4b.31 TaxID=1285586 RepID=R7ZE15_LYSSH|nr:phage scaffolding protein [Lysinibacillus sphaericus]EON72246.1 scaffold protein gp20 membrane protease membrane protease membrane protease [Lysinibacillus sphaericus OT4b.31]